MAGVLTFIGTDLDYLQIQAIFVIYHTVRINSQYIRPNAIFQAVMVQLRVISLWLFTIWINYIQFPVWFIKWFKLIPLILHLNPLAARLL